MPRIRILLAQEYELPTGAEIADGPGGKLIKLGNVYLSPTIELMASPGPVEKVMRFTEPSEEILDQLMTSLSSETCSVEYL